MSSATTVPSRSATTSSQRQLDPNTPQNRLFLNQQCIYERRLPGDSYVTAHITRLQSGYFDTPAIHEDCINDVRFLAINFVFHPIDTRHRFVSARIALSVHNRSLDANTGEIPLPPQIDRRSSSIANEPSRCKPKILRYAPHLLYGILSPETLDWNFNLAGAFGVTQGPANASLQPSGGVKTSYKMYKMMKIQGSVRTLTSWYGRDRDVEDGELVWTLEENNLQKSGLPREFTFVIMLSKGHSANDVQFNIDIEPTVASWYGVYPKWWLNRIWYQPLPKAELDLDKDLGQRFSPTTKGRGFNFANIMGTFDDFVSLPGTTYQTSDSPNSDPPAAGDKRTNRPKQVLPQPPQTMQQVLGRSTSTSPAPITPKDLNIRVFLENYQPSIANSQVLNPPVPSPHVSGPQAVPSQSLASPRSQSSRSSLPIQSTSPLPDTTFSLSKPPKPRSRPPSAVYSQPPPTTTNRPTNHKPRPVSTIYETSTPSPVSQNDGSRPPRRQRPLSNETDFSEDLHIQSTSPLGFNAPISARSKSLRHRRSNSDLTEGFTGPESQHQRNIPPEQSSVILSTKKSNGTARKPVGGQQPLSSFQAYNSHSSTIISTAPIIGPSSRGSRPSNDSSSLINSVVSPIRQSFPTTALNGNPVQSNVSRNSSVKSKTERNLNARPSFPPTSYPLHSMNNGFATNSTTTSDNASAPAVDVDNLVQQEVDNFLKAHPELRAPIKSRSHGRNNSVSISSGSNSGYGLNGGGAPASVPAPGSGPGSGTGLYGEITHTDDNNNKNPGSKSKSDPNSNSDSGASATERVENGVIGNGKRSSWDERNNHGQDNTKTA